MTRNVVMRKITNRRSDYQIINLRASLDDGLRATRAWGTADRPSALTWIVGAWGDPFVLFGLSHATGAHIQCVHILLAMNPLCIYNVYT